MVHVRGAELDKPRVSPLALVHLEQALLYARVNAGGDSAPDLHALARQRMLVVVTVIGSDAPGVSQRGSGQVTGLYGSSEHAAPQEFTCGNGFIKLGKQFLRSRTGEGGDEA